MKIHKDIEMLDLGLYLNKYNTLIISDMHIGYEEALNKQGVFIPRFQFKEIIGRLDNILKVLESKTITERWGTSTKSIKHIQKMSPQLKNNKNQDNKKNQLNNKEKLLEKIIINGDIKHEFGSISEQEWRHTLQLLDYLKKYCNEVILIKGNHDKILGPIANKRNVKVEDHLFLDDILITHGDRLKPTIIKKAKTIIIGHEHPAIGLRDGPRTETFKCFLKGKYKDKTLIVQPSFNLVTEGTDVSKERLLSPFLKQDLSNFNAYIISEDKVLDFGILRRLKSI